MDSIQSLRIQRADELMLDIIKKWFCFHMDKIAFDNANPGYCLKIFVEQNLEVYSVVACLGIHKLRPYMLIIMTDLNSICCIVLIYIYCFTPLALC